MKLRKTTPLNEEPGTEPVAIREAEEQNGKVRVRLSMSAEFHSELYAFLNKNGLTYWGNDKKVTPIILHCGLSDENYEELEKYREELSKVSSRYASINFQTSDFYAKNCEIAMGLRYHLQESKSLKKQLKASGFSNLVAEDEWDTWDETIIDELYRKYVFGN